MHPNPAFRQTDDATALTFARQVGFGLLSINGDATPMVAHVPFFFADEPGVILTHLVRSNPVARQLADGPLPALLSVSGPHGYISPDWYEMDDQVPTWNYVAVAMTGQLALLHNGELGDVLDRQTAEFEARLAPKPAWTRDKMDADALARMMRQIQPVRLDITSVASTWKLGQNKPDDVRRRAADALGQSAVGSQTERLAKMMREAGRAPG